MAAAVVEQRGDPFFKGFARDWSRVGPASPDYNVVNTVLSGMGIEPDRTRVKPSRLNQVNTWDDVLMRYAGAELVFESQYVTAALLNERGDVMMTLVAPLFPTPQQNFTVTSREPIMIPFDEMNSRSVPRYTTHLSDTRSYSTRGFKRMQRISFQAMHDPIHGREMLDEIVQVLLLQAKMTIVELIQTAMAFTPFQILSRRFSGGAERLNCARQIHMETACFAELNSSPADFIGHMRAQITPENRVNLIILPQGAGGYIRQLVKETRSVPAFAITYDAETNAYLNVLYDGPTSLGTMPGPLGEPVDFIENPRLHMSTLDARAVPEQTLLNESVFGDVALQRSDDVYASLSGDPTENDPWVHNQSGTDLQLKPLRHIDGLKACGIWNNADGSKVVLPETHSDHLKKHLENLNRTLETRNATLAYFNTTGRNNNEPDVSLIRESRISNMPSFRNQIPFVARNDAGDRLVFPEEIGRMEERVLPNEYIERAARCIIEHGAPALGLNVSLLEHVSGTEGPAQGEGLAHAISSLKHLFDVYLPDSTRFDENVYNDLIRRGAVGGPKFPAPQYMLSGLTLRATPGHTVDQYLAAHPLSTLQQRGVSIDRTSPWAAALEHVPSNASALQDYLTFAHAAQQPNVAQAAIDNVLQTLAAHSGKVPVAAALADVGAHLRNKEPFDALATKVLVAPRALKSAEAKQPLHESELQFKRLFGQQQGVPLVEKSQGRSLTSADIIGIVLNRRRGAVDAMDIDAPAQLGRIDPIVVNDIESYGDSVVLNARLDYIKTLDPLVAIVMLGLVLAKNSLLTHHTLAARLGIHLFRINFWRLFQRLRMYAVVGCRSKGDTYRTPYGHAIMNTAEAGIEGMMFVVAQFMATVLPENPQFTMYLPNALCAQFIGGCNTQLIRSKAELQNESAGKPGVLALPVPIDETIYQFPLHVANQDIFPVEENDAAIPLYKHSSGEFAKVVVGIKYMQSIAARDGELRASAPIAAMSLVGHRSNVFYTSGHTKTLVAVPGTGPRGDTNRCVPAAAKVFAGHAQKFPLLGDNYTTSAV